MRTHSFQKYFSNFFTALNLTRAQICKILHIGVWMISIYNVYKTPGNTRRILIENRIFSFWICNTALLSLCFHPKRQYWYIIIKNHVCKISVGVLVLEIGVFWKVFTVEQTFRFMENILYLGPSIDAWIFKIPRRCCFFSISQHYQPEGRSPILVWYQDDVPICVYSNELSRV